MFHIYVRQTDFIILDTNYSLVCGEYFKLKKKKSN
jgi:hypothetical protein